MATNSTIFSWQFGTRKNQGKVEFYGFLNNGTASTAIRIAPRIFLGPDSRCARTNYISIEEVNVGI